MTAQSKAAVPLNADQRLPDNVPKKKFRSILRIFRQFVVAADRRRLALAFAALVLSSGTNLMFPGIMGKAIDYVTAKEAAFSAGSGRPSERAVLALVLSIFGCGAFSSWLRVYSFQMTGHRVEQRLRKALFAALLSQDLERFDASRVGDAVTRLLVDAEVASKVLAVDVASALRGINSAAGGTAMLFLISPKLTLVTLSLAPLLGMGAMLYRRRVRLLAAALRAKLSSAIDFADERLSNIRTVRLFAKETHEAQTFAKQLDSLSSWAGRLASSDGLLMGGLSFAMNASLIAVLSLGGYMVKKNEMSVGNLTSFALYSAMVGLGFSSLSRVYSDFTKASVSADRIFEVLDRPTKSLREGIQLPIIVGAIEMKNVGFSYASRPDAPVLRNLSCSVLPGQVVGVAGASGVGKTTLLSLFTRLLDPSEGTILLDGVDIKKMDPTWLRDKVFGVVNQEPSLFNCSIEENIRYGRPDATMEEVIEAATQASAHEFISQLPLKYHTNVGEKGAKLSVGQKQRIAIARAVLKNPPCLILDEATSSLDGEAERSVQKALERLMAGRTVILIAHRASSLKFAHRIEYFKDGTIVDSGSFDDLMARADGAFVKLLTGDTDRKSPKAEVTSSRKSSDVGTNSTTGGGAEMGTETSAF